MDPRSYHLLRLCGLIFISLLQPALAAPPTLSGVSDLGPVNEDTTITFSHSTLVARSNVNDDVTPDDEIQFSLRTVLTGTLRDGGGNVLTAGALLSDGESWN
jgi:hypothetical protein